MFVKICGITSEEDALLAVALGAHAVGFVFAPSPRQIAPQIAADIVKRLPPEVISVGVFRDWAPQRVSDVAHAVGLHAVQLHGHEPAEAAQWLKTRVPMVIQAFAAGDGRVRKAADYGVDAVLLDAPSPGSAQVFDWSLASEVPPGQRVIIAGGLDASNVEQAVAQTRCWGVDVSSGVERTPGYKDPIKLREFIQAALAALARVGDDAGAADDFEGATDLYDWQDDQ
ncbi:MAG TPA: phosphoribosylanthranilate isomerase [Acidimicrobiales bacterium]|nr:phosphoribosylanthranilate isomerase [Acidimicrobiales bacterium]